MTTETANPNDLLRRAMAKIAKLTEQLAAGAARAEEPIAIVGMGCRLPGGGRDPESFWHALIDGVDAVKRIPEERWLAEALTYELAEAKWASLLETRDIENFDAAFFGISPREASRLDPQQRILLEVAWEALEDAGQDAAALAGARAGVYVGLWRSDYSELLDQNGITDLYRGIGCLSSTASGRISYMFGLQGPSLTVDTACSSSLVTVHLACQSLRTGESDLALAGGVNLILDPRTMKAAAEMGVISPDGHCKSFDARANGYVRAEGCGIVVLKRLSDALRDGDRVLSLILSTAVNQDGRSTGLTVPNVLAQQSLLREALRKARLAPRDIGYIETHGTGTALGDPIEFEALRGVFGPPEPGQAPTVLGAAKTNIGHAETAAGVAGLIKTVYCLDREVIPKNLHFDTLNPRISTEGTPFVFPNEAHPWPRAEAPRRAGVSSFGIAGTNAHIILEEAPRVSPAPTETQDTTFVLPLSAKTPAALAELAGAYAEHLGASKDSLRDIAYTASCRRTHLEHRAAVVGQSAAALAAALSSFARDERSPSVLLGKAESPAPQVVFVFSGQGSQWTGMGLELMRRSAVFREAVEACERAILKAGGFSVIAELEKGEADSRLHRTEVAQLALFTMQVGLVALLKSYGVEPQVSIGHSAGEVAAAYAAGVFDLETACRVLWARAVALSPLAGLGKMVAVKMTEVEARAAVEGAGPDVVVAAVNGPTSCVLSGKTEAVLRVVEELRARGVMCKEVRVDYAFHSPQADGAAAETSRIIGEVAVARGTAKLISTVMGREVKGTALDAHYWGQNVRQAVLFAHAIREAMKVPGRIFLEVGPHAVLSSDMGELLAETGYGARVLPTLRRQKPELAALQAALAALHVRGVKVDFAAEFGKTAAVVALPKYPWQRQHYFFPAPRHKAKQPGIASQYYDAMTRLVETVQGEREVEDKHDMYLTFAPFTHVVPGFSWMKCFLKPEAHPDEVRRLQDKQLEMRRVLFRHVDFSACAKVLDFGCGFSTDLVRLAKEHPHLKLDGYTISPEQAEVGQRRVRERGLQDRVSVHNRDSAKDAFPASYDLVFGFEVAHHIKDKAALFSNIGEHMSPGGTLVLADFISNVTFEIEHDASSSFFLMVDQWTELLSANKLAIEDVIDLSRQISNFLHDPRFDEHLAQMRAAGEDENVLVSLQSYDRLGKMLDRGLASYILLSAKRAPDRSADELREANRAALTNLLAYTPSSADDNLADQLLFGVEWRPSPAPTDAATSVTGATGAWLLVGHGQGAMDALAARLGERGIRAVRVMAGPGYEQLATDQYRAELSAASFQKILQEAFGHDKPCARAVYASGLDVEASGSASAVLTATTEMCMGATYLAQALVKHGFRAPPRLYLITRGAQSVLGDERVQVGQAPLWGFGKALALEHAELKCTRLDLDPAVGDEAATIEREVGGADREDQVALRGGERYAARLVRAPLAPAEQSANAIAIRADRSYLVTGGLGGLGLSLARWLVEKGAGRVILAGRRAPTEEAAQVLRELNIGGERVVAAQADVSREEDLAKLVAEIGQSDKPLAGVLHAAGLLHDKTLLEQTRQGFEDVLGPKVIGAWSLSRLIAPETLDFFVMYSSAAALCGSPGQANYCAANAFMDALAELGAREGQKWLSVQWGAFSEVGMAVAQDNRGKRVASLGLGSISPREGHQVLEKLLASPRAVVGVLKLNARQWVESMPSAAGLPFFSDIAKTAGAGERSSRLAQRTLERLQKADPTERAVLMAEHLCEEIGGVLQMEPSRIDQEAPFQSLGVDSLMSLEIRNRLEERLGARLGATVLYTYTTISSLKVHLLEILGLVSAPLDRTEPWREGLEPALRDADLENLSDEALARMGEALLA